MEEQAESTSEPVGEQEISAMVCEFAGPRWWQCAEGGGWLSGWLVSASYQQPAGDGIKPTSVTLE